MSALDRRSFVKAAGLAAGAAALPGTASAGAAVSTRTLDTQFDLSDGLQEALVVFDDADSASRLDTLDLAEGYRLFETLGIAWTFLDADQLTAVVEWDEVRRVKKAEQLEWYNDTVSRASMTVDVVQNDLGYLGEDAHVVVIDSGINASHLGLDGRVEANYRYVDQPLGSRDPIWVDIAPGDTDTLGHGTHCAGIVGGDGGGAVDGDYAGMAPKVTLTGYSTTQAVYLPYVVAAWEHMLGRAVTDSNFNPDVVSNSYGVARGMAFNPNDPVNVASWKAFEMGILPVFAMGNDGPGLGTGSRFAKAPYVLGVAAAEKSFSPDDADNTNERPVAGFSSRGRAVDAGKAEDEPAKYVDSSIYHDRDAVMANLRRFKAIQYGTAALIDERTFTGSVGPGVNTSPGVSFISESPGTSYEQFTAPDNADLAELTLSLSPDGQWVRTTVYDADGDRVAMMGEEPLHQHRTLTFDVSGGDYYVELEPEDAASADYTLELELHEKRDGDLDDVGPVTLFRPGISTHGVAVMSTIDRTDALGNLGPLYGGSGTEAAYARLSGTSMACPGAAGIAALVYEAHRAEAGTSPDPYDVIRIVECTAANHHPEYTPANTGAGFVDAAAAVRLAERVARGEATMPASDLGVLVDAPARQTPTLFTGSGSRGDDGSAFTGGQTDQVTVTVDALNHDADQVYDFVPDGWTVLVEHSEDVTRTEAVEGGTRVHFGPVPASEAGDTTFTYFAEAPESTEGTGEYTFGPLVATTAADVDDDAQVQLAGTETNTVVGLST